MPSVSTALLVAAACFVCPPISGTQDPPPATQSRPEAPAPSPRPSIEIDQTVVNVQTTMPLKRHRGYFKITHRFARDLRRGSFGQLAEDAFSLDNGAIIGLEYRYALTSRVQAGVHRSILGKTVETFGKWDVRRQSDGGPFGLSVGASIEGQNNLHLDPQPGISATLSHVRGTWLALYANPTYVHNAHTATLRLAHEGHSHGTEEPAAADEAIPGVNSHDTAFIGLGMRVRVRETVSLVAEGSPRLAGYRPDRAAWNVGVEKLTRGHVLQLNFGNNFDSTAGMVARGGSPHDVYMGFNLSRKF
jgi:hypothetical protein